MKTPITDEVTIRRMIAEHGRWWHEIELAPGIVTPGDDSNRMKLPILDRLGLLRAMNGMRALDIGCSDGYFTFEMERRGANVVAIDFVPETYTGFATARTILGSEAEYRLENVYNLAPEKHGVFDVVLFMGVLYHLRKPLAALDAIRSVMRPGALLFVGTMMIDEYFLLADGSVTTLEAVNPLLRDVPLWQAYPGDSLNGDFTLLRAESPRARSGADRGAVRSQPGRDRFDGRLRARDGCRERDHREVSAPRQPSGAHPVRSGRSVLSGRGERGAQRHASKEVTELRASSPSARRAH